MINSTSYLSEQQLQDLEQLKAICQKTDGSVPNLYPHILAQRRALPANVLYYDQFHLTGFLSVYFFYDKAVEVALLIHPSVRRRGVAKKLIQTILPLIKSHSLNTLIFSSPSNLNDQWLTTAGLSFLHSEYYMERHDLKPLLEYKPNLTFREATINDIAVLSALDKACFPNKDANPVERFQQLFDDRNYQIFIAFQNGQPVGKAHIRWQEKGATLSDITVMPSMQGKGIGTALITYCINYALSEGKPHLSLDVETHNKRALNLYTRLGFVVENACDYWSISVNQVEQRGELSSQAQ